MKEKDLIDGFKHVTKTWTSYLCLCRLCTVYSLFTKYWIFGVCLKKKKERKKIHICLGKPEYHNRVSRLPYVVHLLLLV